MLRYPPMTEGYIFLPRAVRPEVKKYIPRSEVDHLGITTDKEVVFLYNFRSPSLPPKVFFRFKNRTKKRIYYRIIKLDAMCLYIITVENS